MNPNLFAALVAAAILVGIGAFAALSWLLLRMRHENRLRRRLATETTETGRDFDSADATPLVDSLARSGKAIERMVDTEGESGRLLVQAGWRTAQARVGWYVFQAALPVLLFGGVLAFWTFAEVENRMLLGVMAALMAAILSFLAPRWTLRRLAAARLERIRGEVPLLIHLLVLMFEAGLATRQALSSIVREGAGVLPELGHEFDGAVRQVEAGAELSETLRLMADVLPVDDLATVLGILRQVDRYGGELREPLLETLKNIEEQRGYELRERVNLMSGRMTLVMVMFFFPALMIFVAGPAFLAIVVTLGKI
ncbi:tight adherence protein C [Solimonas aquatica]|uniref:Tight adherence protein C n=1 Tax=Solimonas aquatica TaxID=489703 RepID=A0A1H9H4P9_9GAMM|nr:type II secretion system F family protein [Solimonas aquatica]SEQ57197.1 tight adherence protein C [Solimonas aquatica]